MLFKIFIHQLSEVIDREGDVEKQQKPILGEHVEECNEDLAVHFVWGVS